MQSLSDDLLLGVLEYVADPADWARWSATCRRFRYNIGVPVCLQLVQQLPNRTRNVSSSSSSSQGHDIDTAAADDDTSCKRLYLPQLIFAEFPESTRLVRAHQVDSLVANSTTSTAPAESRIDTTTSKKYRLFTFHAPSHSRAYLSRNHEHPNPLIRHSRTTETHVHGLAFHVDTATTTAPSSTFRTSQQNQYWILYAKNENDDHRDNADTGNSNTNDEESSSSVVARQLQVVGNCSTPFCPPPILYDPTDPRLLAVDHHGNWFVQSQAPSTDHARHYHDTGRTVPVCNTYGLKLWTASVARSTVRDVDVVDDSNDNDTRIAQTTTTTTRIFLPAIPIQPKPFLSHNGGWNIYEPSAWESVLKTDVRNGMTRHAQLGRSTSLYFHAWIQDSRMYIHAQYLVFPLSIPILQQDQVNEQRQSGGHSHDGNDGDDKEAMTFLCNFLWNLFAHDTPRWYAIRHYLSIAANELQRIRQMTRTLVERGGDPAITPVLPPPARVDNVADADDDGSMGLTATHAANTWIVPPQHHAHYSYQAVYVQDPDRQQLRPWNNVLNVVVPFLSGDHDGDDAPLDPNAPTVPKNMNQPAWSIVFYA